MTEEYLSLVNKQQTTEQQGVCNISAGATGEGAQTGCPDCGADLRHEGGCAVCQSCGYSQCG